MKIIRDTREKVGYWDFSFYGHEQYIRKLDTGDYSIEGYENNLCIERKKSTSELAINIGSDSKRFEAELERMKIYKYKYIILEFSVDDVLKFPKNSNIPKALASKIKISGQFIMKKILEYEKEYGVEIIFAGNQQKAIDLVLEIFQEIVNESNT